MDHPDRVAMLSDLEGLDARLDDRLKATLAEVRALIADERRHFDAHLEGRLKDTFADVRILVAEKA